jgi:TonB family protein
MLALWFYDRAARRRSKAGMHQGCASPYSAISFSDAFLLRFENDEYGLEFEKLNSKQKLGSWGVVVTPTNAGQLCEADSYITVPQMLPKYPAEAAQNHVEGSVKLLATVAGDGHCVNIKLLQGDALLADAAISAVKGWTDKLHQIDGRPIECEREIRIAFKLSH